MKIKLCKHFSLPIEIVLHTYNQLIEADESLTLCQKIGDVQEKLEKCKLPIYNPFCDLLAKWGVLYVPV